MDNNILVLHKYLFIQDTINAPNAVQIVPQTCLSTEVMWSPAYAYLL